MKDWTIKLDGRFIASGEYAEMSATLTLMMRLLNALGIETEGGFNRVSFGNHVLTLSN